MAALEWQHIDGVTAYHEGLQAHNIHRLEYYYALYNGIACKNVHTNNNQYVLIKHSRNYFIELSTQKMTTLFKKNDINRLEHWANLWSMNFNPNKCVHLRITNKKSFLNYNYIPSITNNFNKYHRLNIWE